MFAWLRDLTADERKTMVGSMGGWALDAFDVQLFSFVIPTLLALWEISRADAGLLGTVTLLVSAIGGWAAGALSDRYGRVKVLQFTIVWYAVFTFLCGFAHTYAQLFVLRALQGLGFGAEWSAGAVLMGEAIRDRYRGRAVGLVQSGWAIGWGAAALVYTVVFTRLPEATSWRVLFWIGLAPALLVFWLRKHVDEPAVFRQRTSTQRQPAAQLFAMLRRPYLATTLKVALMVTGAQGGLYALAVWLPTYLRTARGLSIGGTGAYLFVHILGAWFGFLAGAYLADAIGRRATFFVSALGAAFAVVAFLTLPLSNDMQLWVAAPLGFVVYMMFSPMGSFMTELYPTEVRGAAQGFCYNIGRAIGAVFPALVGLLADRLSLGIAIAVFAFTAYGLQVAALLVLPETKGRRIAQIATG
ncbi:MAG: MFS transporter [Polyangiaceae bacterium]|nr:MFS transporter [Polyangiaceae bacterium]